MTKNKIPEWAGAGINGAPSFQGVAYGYGGRAQLAGPPRPLPDDFEKIVDDLVAGELEDMFGEPTEPVWTKENTIKERNQSDQFYSDLPGFPAVNTLVAKKDFVPVDAKAVDDVDWLGPTVNGVALKDIPNNTSSNWKATTPEKRGKATIDMNALVQTQELPEGMVSGQGRSPGGSWHPNVLVAPKDWDAEREELATGDMDAKNPIGGMGVLMKGQAFIPDSAENQMPTAWRESVEKPLITQKENTMPTQNLVEMIRSLVLEALEEAEVLPSDTSLQMNKSYFDSVLQKYGGDYAKASASPEWKQGLASKVVLPSLVPSKNQVVAPDQAAAQAPQKPGLNMQQRLQALRPTKGPTGTTGTAPQQNPQDQQQAHNAKIAAMKSKYAKPGTGAGMGESVVIDLIESIIDEILDEGGE